MVALVTDRDKALYQSAWRRRCLDWRPLTSDALLRIASMKGDHVGGVDATDRAGPSCLDDPAEKYLPEPVD